MNADTIVFVWSYSDRQSAPRTGHRCAYVYAWLEDGRVTCVIRAVTYRWRPWPDAALCPELIREWRGEVPRSFRTFHKLHALARDWCAHGVTWVARGEVGQVPPRGSSRSTKTRQLVATFTHPQPSARRMLRRLLAGKGPGDE